MSLNQWKLLTQLKDSLSKLSNDKSFPNLFNKEILQKITHNNEVIKYFYQFKSAQAASIAAPSESDDKNVKDKSKDIDSPRWRTNDLITKASITSQTDHVLLSILTAENDQSLLQRIEAFIFHLKQYPQDESNAVQLGAIRLLLRKRAKCKDSTVQEAIREALTLLGYVDPVPKNGIRILSMDGGGIRGLLVLEMLKKLEEITGKKTHELFDFMCGVSTGAILSYSIGIHHKELDEVARRYKEISMEVFKQSAIRGTGSLVWSQAYYDTALWEKKLADHLGEQTLISTSRNKNCPKLCAVSAVVNQKHLNAFVFRNYNFPWRIKSQYFGCSSAKVWQAARASAAAPTIFEEFKLGNFLHQDGGILVNNPTALALHEAKLIWPNTPIQCVVSFGTGRSVPSPSDYLSKESIEKALNTSWANKFYKLLDSATDTEGVHIMLNDLLPQNVYYRFNPYLTEIISMVEINPKKIEQLERDALMYLRRNEDKFQDAAQALVMEKGYKERMKDYFNYQRDLYGF